MRTSTSFQAGARAVLLLLAFALPVSMASGEERQRSSRKAHEKPALLNKMGGFFLKASRNIERSLEPAESRSVRSTSATVKYTGNAQPASTTSSSGLPGAVVLSPRTSPSSTVIYMAPDKTQYATQSEEPFQNAPLPTGSDGVAQSGVSTDGSALTVPTTTGLPAPVTNPAIKPKPPLDRSKLPTAQKTEMMGRVVSPYPPHRELDVAGLPSGSLARDPSVDKIFILP